MRASLVTDYLEDTAEKFPDKMAFADERHSLTFRELRSAALHVANDLMQRNLFKRPVAVFMEKCVECVACFTGTAYSGNFYTPIDVKMPEERIGKIMETLRPGAILTNKLSAERIGRWGCGIPVIAYEDVQTSEADVDAVLEIRKKILDTDILYVLFTSGSTGVPKGVVIPHRAVVNFIEWFVSRFSIDDNTTFGNQCPLYFDLSVQDIYGPWKTGCSTYFINKTLFSFPVRLMQCMVERKINTIVWVPSALCMVSNLGGLKLQELPDIRKVLFCGEVMPNRQLNQWRKAYPDAVFVNLYGPTEACDAMAYYVIDRAFADDEALPIGRAIDNVGIIVLREDDTPVIGDEQGELCIRGAALAHGYYNHPAKTQEAFVQNPLHSDYPEIIYRTGDIVHYNELGELVYNGRKDFQIKHMGHRIELGEIEVAASALQGISHVCCLYDQEKKEILLFYAGDMEENTLAESLAKALPAYMIPKRIIRLDSMPLNANGKIDRKLLKNNYISQ